MAPNQLLFSFFTNQFFFPPAFFPIKVDEGKMYFFHFAFFPLTRSLLHPQDGNEQAGEGSRLARPTHGRPIWDSSSSGMW